MIYWKKLEEAMNEHRAESLITCAEDCWCWRVEAAIIEREAAQQGVQSDDCPSCAGSGKKEIGGMLLTCLACNGTGNRR